MSIVGFRGKRIDELGKPFYTGLAHDEFIASFVNEAGTTAKVYIGYFHSQNQQEELIDYRYNWLHEGAEPVEVMSSASALSMKKNRVQGKDTDYTVFFTYYINGRNIIDTKMAKLASLIDVLTRQRSNGAIIMILFDGETYESTGDKEEFLRQVMDMATSRLPGG
jgi:EpsI family protein